MSNITFDFDEDTFVDVISFFANEITDLDVLKIVKLIYLADREYLLRYGRLITGDTYYHLRYGPVPSKSYDILKAFLEGVNRDRFEREIEHLSEWVFVERKPIGHPIIKTSTVNPYDHLSQKEIEVLSEIISEYKDTPSGAFIDITKYHKTAMETPPQGRVDYLLFFRESENDERSKNSASIMLKSEPDRKYLTRLRKDK